MRIGVDLGGTKIEVLALDSCGEVLLRRRAATPAGSYSAILETIAGLVEGLETELGEVASVGVGSPGAASLKTGAMKNCNTTCLNGQPLQGDLSARLGREVRLANDANCFALSEAVDGSGAEATTVFGVILGTGVGGGLVVNKQLLVGGNAIAGEWGHNPLPGAFEDRPCYCRRRDCIETYLCGAGLLTSFRRHGGRASSVEQLVALADSGDACAGEVLENYCRALARALALVINIVDPEVIVLGGGLSNIPLLYRRVPELWGQWVFSDECRSRLLPARYGDSSGVRGAAWLW